MISRITYYFSIVQYFLHSSLKHISTSCINISSHCVGIDINSINAKLSNLHNSLVGLHFSNKHLFLFDKTCVPSSFLLFFTKSSISIFSRIKSIFLHFFHQFFPIRFMTCKLDTFNRCFLSIIFHALC